MCKLQHRSPSGRSAQSFLNQVRIRQEPRAQLSKYLLAADAALKRKDLQVVVSDFSHLREIYDEHEDTWNGLVPCFDAATQTIDPNDASCFVAYDTNGDAVSAVAVRVWDISGSNLRDEIESLRLFYGNGADAWRNRTQIRLTAPIAEHLTGRIMYCGAFWVRPDHRGIGLGSLLPALASYYAMGRWPIDYKISIGAKVFHGVNLQEMYQFEAFEPEFTMTVDGAPYYKGGLLWSRASHVLDKLGACMDAIVDRLDRPHLRHREQPSV